MAAQDAIIGDELGPEFDQGVAVPNQVTLKLGAGLAKSAAGVISAASPSAAQVAGTFNATGAGEVNIVSAVLNAPVAGSYLVSMSSNLALTSTTRVLRSILRVGAINVASDYREPKDTRDVFFIYVRALVTLPAGPATLTLRTAASLNTTRTYSNVLFTLQQVA